MLIYEITEHERRQIMEALEWAKWALEVSMQTAKDERAEPHVIDNLAVEKRDMGALWDRIAALKPMYGDGSEENPFTTPDLPEWYG
jgi:hypothetical protein